MNTSLAVLILTIQTIIALSPFLAFVYAMITGGHSYVWMGRCAAVSWLAAIGIAMVLGNNLPFHSEYFSYAMIISLSSPFISIGFIVATLIIRTERGACIGGS